MATREYKGARYVPIFGRVGEESIQWDNTAPYEPLTIVLYQGNSYTSRQYVPAGIDIANTQYWALTGNFNAQVEQYRTEVQGFADDIQANADAIQDIRDELASWIVKTAGIADGAVTTDKIANGAVTVEKLSDDVISNMSRYDASNRMEIFPAITDGWFTVYSGRFYEGTGTDVIRPFIPAGLAMVSRNLLYCALINAISNNVDIYECDRISNRVSLYKSNVFMGHCNTMTYSPVTNRFYVMPGQSNLGDNDNQFHNVVFVYDRTFGNMQRYVAPGTVGCISFDHATQKLVYVNNENGNIYDIDETTMQFTERETTIPTRNVVHSDVEGIYIFQGGAVYNDYYVAPIGWNGSVDPNLIAVYDLATGKYLKSYIQPKCTDVFPLGELEDCAFDEDGTLYISAGNQFLLNTNESNQTTIFKSGIMSSVPMGNGEANVVPQEITVLSSNQYRPTHSGQKYTFKEISEALCYAKYHEISGIRLSRPTNDTNMYWYRGLLNINGMNVTFIASDEYIGIHGRLWITGNAVVHWNNNLRIKLANSIAGVYPVKVYDSIFMADKIHVYPGDATPGACVQILNEVMFCIDGEPVLHDLTNIPSFNTARIAGFGYRTTPFTGQ